MSRRVISAVLTLQDQSFSAGLRRANRQAGDFGRHVQVAQNKVEDFGRRAKQGLKMVGAAASALGVGAVATLGASVAKTVLEMEDSFAKLQAQTGAMGTDLTTLKGAAKEAFASGYGESLDEVSNAVARVKQNMHGIDNGDLANVTKNALLLANVFESDVNEVTRGANNLMDGFGITSQKAFDLFTAGGQRGVNFSNEMFDNMAEFAPLAKSMGFSAEEYFGILERGSQSGVYNLSYVNDALKEFQIMTKDGSKRTSDAMGLMSKETQGVWKSFLKGNGTIKDVSTTIVGELKNMDDQVKAGQIGVELFGTKWEDLESEAMYAMLGSTDAMKGFEGATEAAAASVEGSIGNRMKSAWRDLQVSIADVVNSEGAQEYFDKIATKAEELVPAITNLVEDLIPVITNVVDKAFELGNTIKTNWEPIKETVIGITVAVLAFKLGMMSMSVISGVIALVKGYRAAVVAGTVAQWAFNTASAANPFGLIMAGIAGVVALAVVLYRNWDTVTAKTKEVWESIGGLEGALRIITGPIGIVIGAAVDLAKNWDSTKSVWENVWGAMKRSAADTVNSVIGGINSMIETINKIPGVNIPVVAKVDWGSAPVSGAGFREIEGNYAVGSNRITHDQVANVHKDEMIIPARQSQRVRAAGGNIDNIDKLVSGQGRSAVATTATTTNNNDNGNGGITVIIENIHAAGVSVAEVVGQIVPQLKLALANM